MYKMTFPLSPEVFSKKHASADKYGQRKPQLLVYVVYNRRINPRLVGLRARWPIRKQLNSTVILWQRFERDVEGRGRVQCRQAGTLPGCQQTFVYPYSVDSPLLQRWCLAAWSSRKLRWLPVDCHCDPRWRLDACQDARTVHETPASNILKLVLNSVTPSKTFPMSASNLRLRSHMTWRFFSNFTHHHSFLSW